MTSNQVRREFGEWVRHWRDDIRKITQQALADLIDVDRQTIYRIENAKTGVKRDVVLRIAQALRADPEEALQKAGFSTATTVNNSTVSIDFPDGTRVTMQGGKDLSNEERSRFEVAFRVAYEQAKSIIDAEQPKPM